MSSRKKWDAYFITIAEAVATRATCDRKHVGSVIVVDKQIVASGYNGAPAGMPHCDEAGHELVQMGERESCIRTVHAEANAIAQAAKNGARVSGATIYCTASPCYDCFKLIINAGIKRVVCKEMYLSRYGKSEDIFLVAAAASVELTFIDGEK